MLDMNELGYYLYMDKMQKKKEQDKELNAKNKYDLGADRTTKKENKMQ